MAKPNASSACEITTEEEALEAVKRDGMALNYVSKELRDEVCSMLATSLAERKSRAGSHNSPC